MMGVSNRAALAALDLEDEPAAPKHAPPPSAAVRRRPRASTGPEAATADTNVSTSSSTAKVKTEAETAAQAAEAAEAAEAKPPPKRRGRKRLLHDEEQRKTRRKQQCKLNQRRYRARQRDLLSTLSLETEALRGRLAELEALARFLRAFHAPETAHEDRALLAVEHFFRVFRDGFALHSADASDLQERFLRAVAAPQLAADVLLRQLQRYSSYYATCALVCDQARVVCAGCDDGSAVVEARGALNLRLSRDSLMLVFPHLLRNDPLAARVVGQDLAPTFAAAFYFDPNAKLARVDLDVEYAGAAVALLGDTGDAAALLDGALLSASGELGDDAPSQTEAADSDGLARGGSSRQLSLRYILL